MGHKGITDLLQLRLDRDRLVEDNEDGFLHELSGVGIGDGLLDGGESHEAISAGGAEDHTLEAVLLLGGDDSSDRGETHIKIATIVRPEQTIRAFITEPVGAEFRYGKTRGVGHEEAASLLQDLLKLHLLVVLMGELLGVAVQLLELAFIALELHLERFEELLLLGGSRGVDEGIHFTGGGNVQVETITLSSEKTELALKFIAALDV
mmetsp:Transcript_14488/g.21287  ORF Transcript_14488/g.21287 Transcript_14488/m.21287 type:complete len:207 (+) Transcript_14488:1942-2562(+)